ncbi:SRPBCC family protein [Aureibacillus halotolerans]|uniref:Polyketide cyclase/dehydrase/lipid transport protein n=1 Tax=Aureibacillus halotolerans TaxID=1508390 RepID=A0A4R6U9R0_9BACI|nr:SRPBCC family protein [Aureibacillus halotolerans]TDQ41425.1 hypothetical protein EV213_1032 [Aureibacillus halotolerans]
MPSFSQSSTINVAIKRSTDEVYEYAFDLDNFPEWVSFCTSIRKENETWVMETTYGSMKIKITERNGFGVIDHYVSPAPDMVMYDAMRILPNGIHSEVFMTVFQGDWMSDEDYQQAIEMSKEDLHNLKSIMEGSF